MQHLFLDGLGRKGKPWATCLPSLPKARLIHRWRGGHDVHGSWEFLWIGPNPSISSSASLPETLEDNYSDEGKAPCPTTSQLWMFAMSHQFMPAPWGINASGIHVSSSGSLSLSLFSLPHISYFILLILEVSAIRLGRSKISLASTGAFVIVNHCYSNNIHRGAKQIYREKLESTLPL